MANTKITSDNLDTNIDIAGTLDVTGATTMAGFTSSVASTITTADNTDTLSLISTDSDANSGPNLRMYRNSGSPADGDNIGQIDFEGRNDNSEDVVYASMLGRVRDNTDGTEDGGIQLDVMKDGSLTGLWKYYSNGTTSEFSINDDSIDMDFRVESDGNTHMLFVDGGNDRVGIGTASPSTKLEVNGGIRLSGLNGGDGLKFDMAGSTDYVIKESSTNDVFSFGGLIHHNISSARVGIGTTSPSEPLTIRSSSENINCTLLEIGNDVHATNTKDAWMKFVAGVPGADGSWAIGAYPGSFRFAYLGDRSTAVTTASAEVMRLDSAGTLLVGATSKIANCRIFAYADPSVPAFETQNTTTGSTNYALFFRSNAGTQIGYVKISNTGTEYNTVSDYRLKENVRPMENGLERLNKLNPVKFDWKEDGTSSEGFIAHEAQEEFPDAVSGEKDDETMQGMDYGRITPLLVKAIQEQQTIIEDLKARIEALES